MMTEDSPSKDCHVPRCVQKVETRDQRSQILRFEHGPIGLSRYRSAEMQVSPDSHVEPLLDREKSSYWGHPFGVSTVAFCKGDADACLALLKTRFRPVLDANLWLAGQFDPKKQLVFPKAATDEMVEAMITKEDHPAIRETTDYAGLVKSAGNISVQSGGKLQKTNGRVTRMVVVPISKEECALVFSISHAVADGFTYWKIYNMFIGSAPVKGMTFKRRYFRRT